MKMVRANSGSARSDRHREHAAVFPLRPKGGRILKICSAMGCCLYIPGPTLAFVSGGAIRIDPISTRHLHQPFFCLGGSALGSGFARTGTKNQPFPVSTWTEDTSTPPPNTRVAYLRQPFSSTGTRGVSVLAGGAAGPSRLCVQSSFALHLREAVAAFDPQWFSPTHHLVRLNSVQHPLGATAVHRPFGNACPARSRLEDPPTPLRSDHTRSVPWVAVRRSHASGRYLRR